VSDLYIRQRCSQPRIRQFAILRNRFLLDRRQVVETDYCSDNNVPDRDVHAGTERDGNASGSAWIMADGGQGRYKTVIYESVAH
jgi:hypothetical protein